MGTPEKHGSLKQMLQAREYASRESG